MTDLNSIALQYAQALKQQLIQDKKTATGQLVASIKCEAKIEGKYYSIILNAKDYFQYVNNGRKAGKFPPLEAIRRWISVKPILPRPLSNDKLPTEKQLSYLIGRKIAKRGIPATNSLEKSMNSFRLEQKVINSITEIFENKVNEIIGDFYEE